MLGIVILNYNTWNESIDCVQSIIKHTRTPFKIYLVDNNSPKKATEPELDRLKDLNVELVYNKENSGYAAGNNVGLKKAYIDGCDFFLISNSDVLIFDDSIDKIYNFAYSHKGIGVVGPLIYDLKGTRQPIYMLSKLTALGKIKNMMLKTPLNFLLKKFEKSFIMYEEPEQPLKVFSVSGCCFLITRDCYERVFPFDEHTFLYEEEYILGCKLEDKGIDAFILPNAKIIHSEAVSTGGMNEFSYRCLIDSEQYYLKEYIHSPYFTRYLMKSIRRMNWHFLYKKKSKSSG